MPVARLDPRGMGRAMEITVVVQGAACVVTLVAGAVYLFVLIFIAPWLLAAQRFRGTVADGFCRSRFSGDR